MLGTSLEADDTWDYVSLLSAMLLGKDERLSCVLCQNCASANCSRYGSGPFLTVCIIQK